MLIQRPNASAQSASMAIYLFQYRLTTLFVLEMTTDTATMTSIPTIKRITLGLTT